MPCAMLMHHIISLNRHHKPRLWVRYMNASYFLVKRLKVKEVCSCLIWAVSHGLSRVLVHLASLGLLLVLYMLASMGIPGSSPLVLLMQSVGAPYLIYPSFSLSSAVGGEKGPSPPQNGQLPWKARIERAAKGILLYLSFGLSFYKEPLHLDF